MKINSDSPFCAIMQRELIICSCNVLFVRKISANFSWCLSYSLNGELNSLEWIEVSGNTVMLIISFIIGLLKNILVIVWSIWTYRNNIILRNCNFKLAHINLVVNFFVNRIYLFQDFLSILSCKSSENQDCLVKDIYIYIY